MAENTVQTTGHVWDEDLAELNNPLPNWWIYGLYVTVIFAIVYWIYYPSWPIGKDHLRGIGTVTYLNAEGQAETNGWNTRAKLLKEMQDANAAQKPYFDKIAAMSVAQVTQDPELNSFVLSAGKAMFAENCAACHQAGGQGKVGFYPNLADDDWKYGGSIDEIQATLTGGRRGYMPAFGEALEKPQIAAISQYVLSLSGHAVDKTLAAEGDKLFHSDTGACFYCHGDNAKGRKEFGAPNLTDKIWQWANVPAAADMKAKTAEVQKVITAGLNKGVMPAWEQRLNPGQIKLLSIYVHELGGGK
ncbi:MAG: cytochrome-c oxidase, cbb3-type subunit III [Betaproteobacteria bacterium]|nr:MAG: cytochrome-c oxidase, cbb3-type subunit III [Betaproteobacteria bacterium]